MRQEFIVILKQYDQKSGDEFWFWWPCLLGEMPTGESHGPFSTESDALEDAREECNR